MDIGAILGVFIAWPFLALIPAGVFALAYISRKHLSAVLASLAWLAYFPYEQAMKLRILCSGECNIRVDLLLFYPVLIAVSVFALYVHVKSTRQQTRA